MRIDLHAHSTCSDGTDTPAQLVANAKMAGLDSIAITDHDTTSGWGEAIAAAAHHDVDLVPGIEITTKHQGKTIHLLGYGIDPTNAPLLRALEKSLESRRNRIPATLAKLADLGMSLDEADVIRQTTGTPGRPHIADALVEKGYLASREDVFKGILDAGGTAYVERWAPALTDAIKLVDEAGGRAVVAHPWSRGTKAIMTDEVFRELMLVGLTGIEIDHVDHSEQDRADLRAIATRLGCVVTGGSDYHGSGKDAKKFYLGCHSTTAANFSRLRTGFWAELVLMRRDFEMQDEIYAAIKSLDDYPRPLGRPQVDQPHGCLRRGHRPISPQMARPGACADIWPKTRRSDR